MNRLRSTASFVRRNYERVAERFESGVSMLERRYTPLGRFTPGPFEGWRFLWQPALLGFVALSLILAGCSFTNSPFKLDMANTWFFGEPSPKFTVTPSETRYILSVVLVYGGTGAVDARLAAPGRGHEAASRRQDQVAVVDAAAVGDADDRRAAALQPRRLQLRGPGRDDLRAHQSLLIRALYPRVESVRLARRPAVG